MGQVNSEHRDVPGRSAGSRVDIRFYFTLAALITGAAFSVLFGLVVASAGNYIAFKYFLLFALILALIAAFPVAARYVRVDLVGAIRTVECDGVPGTEIRYSAWRFRITVALMGCCALFTGLAAVEIFIYQDDGFPGAAVISGALCIVFVSFVAAVALGRIRRGHITLSSKGIAQRGWSFESRLSWSAVVGVQLAFIGYAGLPAVLVGGYANAAWDRRYTTRFWRVDRLPKISMLQIDCRQFDVDPHVLYGYVSAYVDNPELRGELGFEAALARARLSRPCR